MFKRISSTLILSVLIALPASAQSAKDLFCRGAIELHDNRHGEAITSFSQAIRINPRFSNAYFYRGIAHHSKNRYTEAIANYNQALSIGSNRPATILDNRAEALAALGDYKQALEDWKLAAKYDPSDVGIQHSMVYAFLKLGSRKSAIAILEKLTERYFRQGNNQLYLMTRDELQKVRSGKMPRSRIGGFSAGGSAFEQECP
ncbi:tetratricopeptide repeat protein [Floridanema aerugineum]|uniref:Tetratricopeptide repeat protein n=1 Tax=Floridaenema aerugineum BLCC-F46 TaxID=3153654 RepID=A0ABV4XBP5_9CYAN